MSALPDSVKDIDLLGWFSTHSNEAFYPNMLVNASHTTDWQWQAVLHQMEELRRLGYMMRLKQDPGGSTYWTVTDKGKNYLRALEQTEGASHEANSRDLSGVDLGTTEEITGPTTSVERGPGGTLTPPPSVSAAPPSPSLAQLLALRLTISRGNQTLVAMATLISPSMAVTPNHSITGGRLSQGPEFVNGFVEFLGSPSLASSIVTLRKIDHDRDIAVLDLQSAPPFDLPDGFLSATDLNNLPADWRSYVAPTKTREGTLIGGTLDSVEVFEGRRHQILRLSMQGVINIAGVSGAPVIWINQLIGIVSSADPSAGTWLGTPISRRILGLIPGVFSAKTQATDWLDKTAIERFSDTTWAILNNADRIRQERKGPAVSTFDLAIAFAQQSGGQLMEILNRFGVSLGSFGPQIVDVSVEGPPQDLAPDIRERFPPVTSYVRRALARARDKADERVSSSIDDSHLLYGLLSLADTDDLLIQGLNKQGITPDKVRFTDTAPVAAKTTIRQAGYKSDDPTGNDLLDISREVAALASVLASKDVEPPLSLGLFGDWGTGKSFFMRRLEGRIRELTEDAQQAKGESQYCQDVVQLTFNAWNYIDKDLWASLASEIFEGLASALAQKRGGDSQAGRALALAAASSSPTMVAETERQKSEAEARLKESEAQLADLQQNQNNIRPQLSAREVLNQAARFAIKDEGLKKQAHDVAQEIGISKGIEAVGAIQTQLLELKNTWSEIIFSVRNNSLWVFGLACLLALVVGWVTFHLAKYYIPGESLKNVAKNILPLFSATSTFLAVLLAGSRKILSFVRRVKASKQELIDKTKHAVDEKISCARESVEKAAEEVKILNQQLENMRADRQMVDFIRQRYESSDYREHLGTIARVRADFKHLSALLRDVQKESDRDLREMKQRQQMSDKERNSPLFPRIDRIILYIDDLDRCPEENVVEVLQAVHLLLAFPLFVVVVGVDPRWLLHSLRQHSVAFKGDEVGQDRESTEEVQWQSTPMNYLEKIFQIPFTLRPIDKAGFAKLVDAFAAPSGTTDRAEPATAPVPGQPSQATMSDQVIPMLVTPITASVSSEAQRPVGTVAGPFPPSPSSNRGQVQPPQTADTPSAESIDRFPVHLHIEEWERNFMKTLHDLIPSPRAGKRFINIYRLLRASVRANEQDQFVGDRKRGEYQCALMLLAILTGYPAEATEILRTLIEEQHPESWGELLSSFNVAGGTSQERKANSEKTLKEANGRLGLKSNGGPGTAGFPIPNTQKWLELFNKLASIEDNLNDRSCVGFSKWAPRVARYSFQSGRVLLHQRQ